MLDVQLIVVPIVINIYLAKYLSNDCSFVHFFRIKLPMAVFVDLRGQVGC